MYDDLARGCGLGNRTDEVERADCIDITRPRVLLQITNQTR